MLIKKELTFARYAVPGLSSLNPLLTGPLQYRIIYMHYNTLTNLYKSPDGNVILGKLEKVQKRATKMIHDLENCSYNEHLTTLNLPSLQYHRLHGDMIMIIQLF